MSDARSTALKALLFASSAAGMLCASPVLAADDAPIATADVTQDATTLSAVDVHGQRVKREPKDPQFVAPLLDTPRSVTVIPQQIIEQTAATSLQDILRTSPGITFGAGEGGQPLADRPFIRGQASGNNIFVDGIRDTGSAKSSTWSRWKSSRGRTRSTRAAARAAAASTWAPRPRACRTSSTGQPALAPTAMRAARSTPTGRSARPPRCA